MKAVKQYTDDLKSMLSSPLTPGSEKPSLDTRRIWIAISLVAALTLVGVVVGFFLKGKSPNGGPPGGEEQNLSGLANSSEGSLVIHFKEGAGRSGHGSQGIVRASSGTLVRVKLLNSLETFDTVPVFAQVVDYALGQKFFGWTLVGDASGDGNVARIKMGFHLARNPQGTGTLDLSGQALSLDGTLGIKAEKVEGFVNRTLVGAGKSGGSSLANSVRGDNDLSGLLLRALLSGLQNEISNDLGAAYNRSAALKLDPGEEFFIQLTENF